MATTGQMGGPLRRLARLFGLGTNGSATTRPDPGAGTHSAAQAVRRDWATLPPLRTPLHRRVDESSHVTQFSTDVRRQLDTPAVLAPLVHQVAMEAPRGIATGIARVVGSRAPHDLADLPLPARDHPRQADDQGRWPTPTPAPTLASDAPSVPDRRGPMAPPAPAEAPPLTRATTSRAAAGMAPVSTAPRILRAAMPSPAPTPSPPVARPAGLTLRRVRAVPDGAPHPGHADRPSPVTSHLAGHDDAPVDPVQGEAPSVPDRPTLGAAPLTPLLAVFRAAGRTEPAAQQRDNTDPSMQRATSSSPAPVERPPSGVGPSLPGLPASARPVTRAQRHAGTSVTGRGRQDAIAKGLEHLLPTLRSGHSDAVTVEWPMVRPAAPVAPPDPTGPPVVARRLPPRSGHVAVQRAAAVAPLVGGRLPLAALDRTPARSGPADGAGPEDGAPGEQHRDGPPVVPVRWQVTDNTDPAATIPPSLPATVPSDPGPGAARSTATGLSQTSSSPGGRVSRQAASARPPDAPPALRPTVAPSPAAVPLRRRRDEPTWPTTSPGVSRTAEHVAPAEGLPLPRFPALLRAVDDVVLPSPTTAPAAAGPVAGPVGATRPGGRPAPPPVQRETEAGPAPATEGAETTPAGGDATTDVNAIFRKLYPRVRDELRWELRVQRERAGMLSDPL